jgi:NAD+ synthase
LQIRCELATDLLVNFIRDEAGKVGFDRLVLGLSGGLDSSTVALLAARAVGPDKVTGAIMPYRTSAEESSRHAHDVASIAGIQTIEVDITPMVDPYFENYAQDADPVRRGNKMARERMSILYDVSARNHALVVGTSNKTELLLGYGTIHGDMASAINPIGDLYKTQVRQLARFLGVPAAVVDKEPSADLWAGQTDEEELGFTYAEVDRLLYHMVDLRWSHDEMVAGEFDPGFVERVETMVRVNQYKRTPPLIAKLSERTINRDFRYARDWGR